MKSIKQIQGSTGAFFASTVGVAVLFIILTAAVGSWKPSSSNAKRENFMDCSMSASCAMH